MSLISETEELPVMPASLWQRFVRRLDIVLAAQRESLALWMPVLFGCGIGVYFGLRAEPPFALGAGAAVLAAAFAVAAGQLRQKDERFYPLWLAAVGVLLFAGGFADAQVRTLSRHTVMLDKPLGSATVVGTVADIEELPPEEGLQIILEDLQIDKLPASLTPQRVWIKVRKVDDMPGPGDRISALVRLSPPAPPDAPGAFDFQRYAWFRLIGAFGFSYNAPVIVARHAPGTLGQGLEALRQAIGARIDKYVPYPQAAIARTIVVQARASISAQDEDAMRAAGLSHLLVIGGLHISIVAGFIFFVSRFLMALAPGFALNHPIKKYAAVLAFGGALFYTLIAGAPVPTLRAMIMTGVVLLAVVLDRLAFSPRLVALAAFGVLAFQPEALAGPSFQMSFAAVTALVILYDRLRPVLSDWYRDGGFVRRGALYFLGICLTTVTATLATAPYSIYQFQTFSPYSVIGNLLAIPVMTYLVMPAGVMACLMMPFGMEKWPLVVMDKSVAMILAVARWVEGLPHAAVLVPAWPVSAIVLITLAGLVLMLWRGRGCAASVVPFLLALTIIAHERAPDVLVSSDAKLMAVRNAGGSYVLSSLRADKFTAGDWLRRNGQDFEGAEKFPVEGPALDGTMACGEGGCRIIKDGRKVAFSFSPATQAEDCAWADLLVADAPLAVSPCRAGLVIDRFDVWRNGAYAVWLDGRRFQSVAVERGVRPWTVSNRR